MKNIRSNYIKLGFKFTNNIQNISAKHQWVLCNKKIIELLDKDIENTLDKINLIQKATQVFLFFYTCIKAFFIVLYYYAKQLFVVKFSVVKNKKNIIFEADRKYRHYNFFRINNNSKSFQVIDGLNLTKLMRFGHVGFIRLIKHFFISLNEFYYILTMSHSSQVRLFLLKGGARNIPAYTYLYCMLNFIKIENPKCTAYIGSGVSLLSFALVSLKIKTVYICHGLISKINPLIFPEFDQIFLYSEEELKYLRKVGVLSKTDIYSFDNIKNHNRAIVIFLGNDDSDNLDAILKIIKLFQAENYTVYLKFHPLVDNVEIVNKVYLNDKVIVVDSKKYCNASDIIKKVRPAFTVSVKASTSNCESLSMGVIPIFFDVAKNSDLYNHYKDSEEFFVYPFEDRALSWRLEYNIIDDVLMENINHVDVVDMLRLR